MRVNFAEQIVTRRLICRPYRAAFVPTYHAWMQDPWLRAQTSSDELTLEEEYAAQRRWVDDDDKLTFIFFEASLVAAAACGAPSAAPASARASTVGMAGDANLFILDERRTRDEYWGGAGDGRVAEVMVMVGEPTARRQGFAREAVSALLRYGAERLGIRGFIVKISEENVASIALFSQLGFRHVKKVAAFKEDHFIRDWVAEDFTGPYDVRADEPGEDEDVRP